MTNCEGAEPAMAGSAVNILRAERIGDATLYLGDCMAIMPGLRPAAHIISDPPYESRLHLAKSQPGTFRTDGGAELKALFFDCIDPIRDAFVELAAHRCDGWFIVFCTPEGVARWADVINDSPMRYKRACVWVKPDAAPQFNGQGPAQGAEMFVTAWAGAGHSRWNAGGKRGVYTHLVNNAERTGQHPTEKPRRLMAEIIADFTDAGDEVLDPFMGSGTTGVAAVQLGRKFVGIECDPTYFALACTRLLAAQRQGQLFEARS